MFTCAMIPTTDSFRKKKQGKTCTFFLIFKNAFPLFPLLYYFAMNSLHISPKTIAIFLNLPTSIDGGSCIDIII